MIHMASYLQLLKDGNTKKKAPAATATRTRNPMNAPSHVAQGANIPDYQHRHPLTTTNLVQKWSSVVLKKQELDEAEIAVQRGTQDDIWISRLALEEDPSDPGYYSDSQPTSTTRSASRHRLGHRPHLAADLIRSYVMQDMSFGLDRAVGMLLARLQRFTDQQRAFGIDREGESTQRRFVIGLKEVARRTKQAKVECLIVAPDLEEDANSGGLDDRMRELLASAYQNQTPVIFALSRSRLGAALGKSLHISALGVLDITGAKSLLDECVQLAAEERQSWLARRLQK